MDQMDNVIRFPMDRKPTPEAVPVTPPPAVRYDKSLTRVIAEGTWAVIWMLIFFVWRIVRWPYAIFCVLQLVRMMIHWDTPGIHADWTFLGYFAVLVIGENFPLFFRPKVFDKK